MLIRCYLNYCTLLFVYKEPTCLQKYKTEKIILSESCEKSTRVARWLTKSFVFLVDMVYSFSYIPTTRVFFSYFCRYCGYRGSNCQLQWFNTIITHSVICRTTYTQSHPKLLVISRQTFLPTYSRKQLGKKTTTVSSQNLKL